MRSSSDGRALLYRILRTAFIICAVWIVVFYSESKIESGQSVPVPTDHVWSDLEIGDDPDVDFIDAAAMVGGSFLVLATHEETGEDQLRISRITSSGRMLDDWLILQGWQPDKPVSVVVEPPKPRRFLPDGRPERAFVLNGDLLWRLALPRESEPLEPTPPLVIERQIKSLESSSDEPASEATQDEPALPAEGADSIEGDKSDGSPQSVEDAKSGGGGAPSAATPPWPRLVAAKREDRQSRLTASQELENGATRLLELTLKDPQPSNEKGLEKQKGEEQENAEATEVKASRESKTAEAAATYSWSALSQLDPGSKVFRWRDSAAVLMTDDKGIPSVDRKGPNPTEPMRVSLPAGGDARPIIGADKAFYVHRSENVFRVEVETEERATRSVLHDLKKPIPKVHMASDASTVLLMRGPDGSATRDTGNDYLQWQWQVIRLDSPPGIIAALYALWLPAILVLAYHVLMTLAPVAWESRFRWYRTLQTRLLLVLGLLYFIIGPIVFFYEYFSESTSSVVVDGYLRVVTNQSNSIGAFLAMALIGQIARDSLQNQLTGLTATARFWQELFRSPRMLWLFFIMGTAVVNLIWRQSSDPMFPLFSKLANPISCVLFSISLAGLCYVWCSLGLRQRCRRIDGLHAEVAERLFQPWRFEKNPVIQCLIVGPKRSGKTSFSKKDPATKKDDGSVRIQPREDRLPANEYVAEGTSGRVEAFLLDCPGESLGQHLAACIQLNVHVLLIVLRAGGMRSDAATLPVDCFRLDAVSRFLDPEELFTGTRLRRLREYEEDSAEDWARAANVDISTYRSWEDGEAQPPDTALARLKSENKLRTISDGESAKDYLDALRLALQGTESSEGIEEQEAGEFRVQNVRVLLNYDDSDPEEKQRAASFGEAGDELLDRSLAVRDFQLRLSERLTTLAMDIGRRFGLDDKQQESCVGASAPVNTASARRLAFGRVQSVDLPQPIKETEPSGLQLAQSKLKAVQDAS
ncbi:MAG: hypothetical protein AAF533_14085 [Acidobacteriota bacterium]